MRSGDLARTFFSLRAVAPRVARRVAFAALIAAASGCTTDDPPRVISSSLVADTADAVGPYHIVSVIQDDRKVSSATVWLARTATTTGATLDVATATAAEMRRVDGDGWEATLPPLPLGTVVAWKIEAEDNAGHTSFSPAGDAAFTFVVGNVPSQPQILTLWRDRGPNSGGTEVLVVGRDFREGMSLSFGPGRAAEVEVLSRAQARVRTPPGPAGVVDVVATNLDGGRAVLPNGFTYFPSPEVEAVIPPSGPTLGGTRVTILGRRFAQGATFRFGGDLATGVVITSDTRAEAVTPAHARGFVTVRVEHAELGAGERPNAYEYIPPPEVFAIEPTRGPDLGGTEVRVTGRFFSAGADLDFDGRRASSVQVVSPELIVARTPAHPVGFSDVTVTNPDLQTGTLPGAFFFFGPPRIDSVEPPFSAVEGGATVEVVGDFFVEGTVVTLGRGPGAVVVRCTFVSAQALSCVTPPQTAGPVDVSVTNPDGRGDVLPSGLVYFQLFAVTPARGPSAGGTTVQVTGAFLPPSVEVRFGMANAQCRWISANRLECVTPPGPPNSFVNVFAQPPLPGQVPTVLVDGYFYVAPPDIQSIVPPDGPLRGGVEIVIRGMFFQVGATVLIGNQPCGNVRVISATEIRCVVPPGQPGRVPVTVTNPDGQSDSFLGFEYVPITATPDWSLVDGHSNVILRGRGFAPGAVVTLAGQVPPEVVIVSATEIRLRTGPHATSGGGPIIVQNAATPPEVSPTRFSFRRYVDRSNTTMAGTGNTSEILAADLDDDGDTDVVLVNGENSSPGRPDFLRNNGSGMFTTLTQPFTTVNNEGNICDVNGDGLPEVVWGVTGGPSRIYRNMGNMTFTAQTLPGGVGDAFETSFHDITGNGVCDLVSLGIGIADSVFRNDGNGNFTLIANAIPHESGFVHDHKLDTGDFDLDGDIDIIVVVDDVNFGMMPAIRHRIYLNDGTNHFLEDPRNRALLESIHGDIYDVRAEDLDNDGDLDIVAPNFNQPPIVLLNDGTGLFTRNRTRIPDVPGPYSAMFMEDIEGDGDYDVFFVSLTPAPHALFLNDGRGFFIRASVGQPQGSFPAFRATAADLNGDGKKDIIQGSAGGTNRMWFAEE